MNRGLVTSWAIGLGLLAGSIAGTAIPARTPGAELRQIAGLTLVFVPALYVIAARQWSLWRRTNGYVRFAVFLISFLVSVVVLVQITVFAFGAFGALGRAAAFAAALAAFGVASWTTFYGGADRIWEELIDRGDVDW